MIRLRREVLSRLRSEARVDTGLEMLLHFYDEAHKQNAVMLHWYQKYGDVLPDYAVNELNQILGISR